MAEGHACCSRPAKRRGGRCDCSSRAHYAGSVIGPSEASRLLQEAGEQVQIHWLAGYLSFGSSEGVFEHVRRNTDGRPAGAVCHVILALVAAGR